MIEILHSRNLEDSSCRSLEPSVAKYARRNWLVFVVFPFYGANFYTPRYFLLTILLLLLTM
jgi:hypothetical protein